MTAICAAELALEMLCDCAAVQSLLEVDSASEAQGLSILDESGAELIAAGTGVSYLGARIAIAAPLLLVEDAGTESEAMGQPTGRRWYGQVIADLIVEPPSEASLTALSTTRSRWARAQQQTIAAQFEALIGDTGRLSRAGVSLPRPVIEHDLRPLRGAITIPLTIDWE